MAKRQIDLKTFRRDFGRLRRAGLVSAPSKFFKGKQAPLKSVQPTPENLKAVKRFASILRGEAKAISAKRVRKMTAGELAQIGAKRVKTPGGEKVIVKAEPAQRVTTTRGQITLRTPEYDVIKLPGQIDEFHISKLDPALLPSPKRDEYFSFKLYGNKTERVFRTPAAMLNFLAKYEAFQLDNYDEGIEHLQIYRFHRTQDFDQVKSKNQGVHRGKKPSPEKRARQRKQTLARTPEWKRIEQREKAAAQAKEYRQQLKEKGGSKYEETKRKARERANRSRGK